MTQLSLLRFDDDEPPVPVSPVLGDITRPVEGSRVFAAGASDTGGNWSDGVLSTVEVDHAGTRIFAAHDGGRVCSLKDQPAILSAVQRSRIFAAGSKAEGYNRTLSTAGYPWILISFVYYDNFWGNMTHRPELVITDSGAFTAWSKGSAIDLGAYIDWCHRYRAQDNPPPAVHVNLDVIPGQRGYTPTEAEKQQGMELSLCNADRIRGEGLPMMEVHHQGEPLEFLDHLVQRRKPGDLLGISPQDNLSASQRQSYCDTVWHHLLQRFGNHLPPCHGLGVTGQKMIFRYPWWSVDSVSWVAPGMYGRVISRKGGSDHDPRTRSPEMRYRECTQYLQQWLKWSDQLTNIWQKRGITWQP